MAEQEEQELWLFDSVTQFLKGPEWAMPVMDFIDDNCVVFDSEEENKMAYMDIFNAFREMVDSLIAMHLTEMGCSTEQFAQLCASFGSTDVGREVLEQILAVDDFVSFKKMMVKRNMELELESLKALQALSDAVDAGEAGAPDEAPADEDDFEAQLQQALALSLAESKQSGVSTGVDASEIDRQAEEAEDADLRMALALSLQLEDERAALDAAGSSSESPPPASPSSLADLPPPPQMRSPAKPPAAAARAAPAPPRAPPAAAAALAPAPSGALGALGALPPMRAARPPPPGMTPPGVAALNEGRRAEREQYVAAAAGKAEEAARAARERDAAEKAQAQAAAQAQQSNEVTASQMRARAEHLKKQRDLILAQRKKAREAEFQQAPGSSAPPPIVASSAQHLSRAAGYSDGAASSAAPSADAHRAMLSKSLAQSMKAGLIGEDAQSLDLHQRIESHHRKVDLELTKAQLRAEGLGGGM